MASTLTPLPPLPPPIQRMTDTVTGRPNKDWYLYLQRLDQHIREIEKRLDTGGL
jgi:hypothetical protein